MVNAVWQCASTSSKLAGALTRIWGTRPADWNDNMLLFRSVAAGVWSADWAVARQINQHTTGITMLLENMAVLRGGVGGSGEHQLWTVETPFTCWTARLLQSPWVGGREGGDLVARSLGDFAILCKIPLYIFGVSQDKNGLLHIFSK